MKKAAVYVHGKGGNADEAEFYKPLFPEFEVMGFDYKSTAPWDAKNEFLNFFNDLREKYDSTVLVANSIGAFFAMNSLSLKQLDKAMLISPVVDMEKLIKNMMISANVTEDELFLKKEILTKFGETLSWDYLSYVREHPIKWDVPTDILYGELDNLTSYDTVSEFACSIGAAVTVMKGGEHWFHTDEQLRFLSDWILRCVQVKKITQFIAMKV